MVLLLGLSLILDMVRDIIKISRCFAWGGATAEGGCLVLLVLATSGCFLVGRVVARSRRFVVDLGIFRWNSILTFHLPMYLFMIIHLVLDH